MDSKIKIFIGILIVGIVLIAGCVQQQENLVNANLDSQFRLKINQTAFIESESLKIKFLDVIEDSRCPSDVICSWQGQVTIIVNIVKNEQNLGDFNLTNRAGLYEDLAIKNFDGYSIKLVKVDPYPKTTIKIELSDFIITLLVSEKPLESGRSGEIYKKGETIKFRIDGKVMVIKQGDEELPPYYCIKDIAIAGNILQLRHSCAGFIGVGIDQYCENGKIKTVEVIHCSDVFESLEQVIHRTYSWDQKAYLRIEEECEGETIHREILKQVPEGKYKIVVYDINGNEKVIKEFTIK